MLTCTAAAGARYSTASSQLAILAQYSYMWAVRSSKLVQGRTRMSTRECAARLIIASHKEAVSWTRRQGLFIKSKRNLCRVACFQLFSASGIGRLRSDDRFVVFHNCIYFQCGYKLQASSCPSNSFIKLQSLRSKPDCLLRIFCPAKIGFGLSIFTCRNGARAIVFASYALFLEGGVLHLNSSL